MQEESNTPPDASTLYRPAALQAARGESIGGIVLTHPLSFAILAALAALIAASLVALFVCGTYTKRTTLHGELGPRPGTGAKLQAHLYAPDKAVGFIRRGDAVLLRYPAFPYQKFGHFHGTVAGVSKIAPTGTHTDGAVPGYRVTVELESQSVAAYGKPQPLQAGMLAEADVLQDTRRLYEWALEPLIGPAGKY
jgi:hypothetical protein